MRTSAVFLVCLIAFAAASTYKSPADAVLNRIDALIKGANDEQSAQTKIYLSQHARCVAEQAFRAKEIQDAKVAAGAAKLQLSQCKVEIPVASSALKQSRADLVATRAQLAALEAEHNRVSKINALRQQDHSYALDAISGAYNIIGQFANGAAALNSRSVFVEVSKQINAAFRIAVKHSFHQHMVPVMSALVQVTAEPATTVSTAALQNVVALLRKLENQVKAAEANRAKSQAAYNALYAQKKGLLNQQVAALRGIIKKYVAYLANLNRCVATERNVLRLARAKLNRNSAILKATVAMCNAYDAKYKLQTKQRSDYVALLAQLRSFVVSTIASYNSGLYSVGDFVHQR